MNDRRLKRRAEAGDRDARRALIERYLPLARSVALQHRNGVEPLEDLVQIACVGLVKAVDRWEPDRGPAFSSYAVPTMAGELRHHLRDRTWLVRPSRSVIDVVAAVEQVREPLRSALGREPTAAEFAERLGQPPELVARALASTGCRWGASLDRENDDEATVGDAVGAPDDGYEQTEARLTFERRIAELDHRARTVLRLRFVHDLLQRDIAERIGLSQMHVSRLLAGSIERLRADCPIT
jgi:RNA polymerase sigma-B factor